MKPLKEIIVNTPSRRYAVYAAEDALKHFTGGIIAVGKPATVFFVSSHSVWKHVRKLIRCPSYFGKPNIILFNDNESAKNLATVEAICEELVRAGADRTSTLIGVGGGVVGDVVGFVAATYLRGVRLIHVPTTLVAQVDSAIGGKTGVNLPEGKNLIGAFYQPSLVVADAATLGTLSDRDYRSGIYEIIKYCVIGDEKLFQILDRDFDKLLSRDPGVLSFIIRRCITQKARVTSLDEREIGLRETLNFGHTFGHALESLTRYRLFRHGEAVGWGMIAAALLGVLAKILSAEDAARIVRMVRRVGPLPRLPRNVSASRLLAEMRNDKKSRDGTIRFVLAARIGSVRTGVEMSDAAVAHVWKELVRLPPDEV